FTPHVVNGRALVDGGLLAPLPLTAMRMSNADMVIAVDLNGPPRAKDQQAATETEGGTTAPASRWWPLRRQHPEDGSKAAGTGSRLGFVDLMTSSLDTMQARIARVQLALDPPGVEVRIPRDASQFYEFWRAAELIALGRGETAKALDAAGYGRRRRACGRRLRRGVAERRVLARASRGRREPCRAQRLASGMASSHSGMAPIQGL